MKWKLLFRVQRSGLGFTDFWLVGKEGMEQKMEVILVLEVIYGLLYESVRSFVHSFTPR